MSIRFRLIFGFIAIVVVANLVLALVTVRHVNHVVMNEVRTRVRLDLNVARGIYESTLETIARFLHALSLDRTLAQAIADRSRDELHRVLHRAYGESGWDILGVVDAQGRLLYRASNPSQYGEDLTSLPVIGAALRDRAVRVGTIVEPREVLERAHPTLAERARFDLRQTPASRPTDRTSLEDGMLMIAAVPVLTETGVLVGALYGANLLNRNYGIVDRIKDQVFRQETFKGRDIGTATIFQDDVRISTNVLTSDGERAVGTRMSAQVYEAVVVRGETWCGPAFVVNDWYITAYEPIRDPDGKIIGSLYVGMLREPFLQPQKVINRLFLIVVALTTLASVVLLIAITQHILGPIKRIIAMTDRVVAGDLQARVGIRPPGELGRLCAEIDEMADAVWRREEQLKRTAQEQIGQSEKLAAIGRLAAGIAHEINNPLTGVLTFTHILRQKPSLDEQDRQDLDVILRETTRVREIVRGLLDFARESPSEKRDMNLNEAVRQTIQLVRSQKEFKNIRIVEDLAEDLPLLRGDKNQLQQVLLNLALNALEAMPGGGTLTIRTTAEENGVRMNVSDTGCGIPKDAIKQVFDPFFTTKPVGKGTGLGLSVTYGIIQQHGGTISVESEENVGTTFSIFLPYRYELAPEAQP